MFCREQAARFQQRLGKFEAAGAKVYGIGNGTAPMAADFVSQFGITYDVFTDPSRQVFKLAGMRHKLGIGPMAVVRAARALARGNIQGKTLGDPFQQGGIMVVSPSGEVWFEHADEAVGAHADADDVLAAVQARSDAR